MGGLGPVASLHKPGWWKAFISSPQPGARPQGKYQPYQMRLGMGAFVTSGCSSRPHLAQSFTMVLQHFNNLLPTKGYWTGMQGRSRQRGVPKTSSTNATQTSTMQHRIGCELAHISGGHVYFQLLRGSYLGSAHAPFCSLENLPSTASRTASSSFYGYRDM